jgi:hypothetical protein
MIDWNVEKHAACIYSQLKNLFLVRSRDHDDLGLDELSWPRTQTDNRFRRSYSLGKFPLRRNNLSS